MHTAHAAKEWTVGDLAELPDDGNRYEVIDGELLVTLAPCSRRRTWSFRHAAGSAGYVRDPARRGPSAKTIQERRPMDVERYFAEVL
jgi:hypothetical protein